MSGKRGFQDEVASNALLGAWQGLIFGVCISAMEIPYEIHRGNMLKKVEMARHLTGRMLFCPLLMAGWSIIFRFNAENT